MIVNFILPNVHIPSVIILSDHITSSLLVTLYLLWLHPTITLSGLTCIKQHQNAQRGIKRDCFKELQDDEIDSDSKRSQ